MVFSFKQFDHIIYGSHVDVYTDHDPLQYMIDNSPKCSKLTRWAHFLSRYDITIRHSRGLERERRLSKPADLVYITAVGIFHGTGRGTLIVQFKDSYW